MTPGQDTAVVDIHGHVTSPELFARLPMPPSLGDVAGMIEQKAAVGIGTTIVGSPVGAGTMVPVPGLDNFDQPADQLEAFHEWVAETVRAHARALRAYVYVNPLGGDELLEPVARRLDQDEFVGIIVPSGVRGEYLGTARAQPFFALAAERGVPVLVHAPAEPAGAAGLGHAGLVEHIARPCDVTMGAASIVATGWLHKYPGLRLVVSNAGGLLALLVEKLDLAQRRGAERIPSSPVGTGAEPLSTALRRLYVDTATPGPDALAAALRTWGPDRLLFGTDSPPLAEPLPAALDRVAALDLSPADRRRVLGDNARDLFRLGPPAPDTGSTPGSTSPPDRFEPRT